jgi:Secretion system C-terminal sorting domain/Bacterial Ig domain
LSCTRKKIETPLFFIFFDFLCNESFYESKLASMTLFKLNIVCLLGLFATQNLVAQAPCGNTYEPNNHFASATLLPLDSTIRSVLGTAGDVDIYKFRTTAQRPSFTVILNELPLNYNLTIYTDDVLRRSDTTYSIDASRRTGLQADSLVFNHLDIGNTYYAVVEAQSIVHATACYALKVRTHDPLQVDIGVDSILSPRGRVATPTVKPRVRIRNYGSEAVHRFEVIQYPSNWGSWGMGNTFNLTTPLQPNETTVVELQEMTHQQGQTSFKAHTYKPNQEPDINNSNDTLKIDFQSITLPIVALNEPLNGQLFGTTSVIPLAATANAIAPLSITKVAFYDGLTLLATDSTRPFAFHWANAPIGTHHLTAQATDNDGSTGISAAVTVHIHDTLDVGMVGVANSDDFQRLNSAQPKLLIRNYGSQNITQLVVYQQLDNQSPVSQAFQNLNLRQGDSLLVTLPTVNYNLGRHVFTAWTAVPNGAPDRNLQNDTLRYAFESFDWSDCANQYPLNRSAETALAIPTDVPIRVRMDTNGRQVVVTYFKFKTVPTKTAFKVVATEPLMGLQLYQYDFARQQLMPLSTFLTDSIEMPYLQDTGTYLVVVQAVTAIVGCYRLKIETKEPTRYDIGIDSIFAPQGDIPTNRFVPRVRVKNYGNVPIHHFVVYWNNGVGQAENLLRVDLAIPLQPDSVVNLSLDTTICSSGGIRRFMAYTTAPNWRADVRLANDTAYRLFRCLSLPLLPPDAGVTDVLNVSARVLIDSIQPIIKVRNYGTDDLTRITVYTQLDSQTIVNQTFTNFRARIGTEITLQMPTMRYAVGNHTLKTWTSLPNDSIDAQPQNDTFRYSFDYPLLTNDAKLYSIRYPYSQMWTDSVMPQFRIQNVGGERLTSVTIHYQLDQESLQSYHWTGGLSQYVTDFVQMPTALRYRAGTHQLLVYVSRPNGRNDANPSNDTLRMTFEYQPAVYDVLVDSILGLPAKVFTNGVSPGVRVRNQGNQGINSFKIVYRIDNQPELVQNISLSSWETLEPQTSRIFFHNLISGYTTGVHEFRVYTRLDAMTPDLNPSNDTLKAHFKYISIPKITLDTPAPQQIYYNQLPIPIKASIVSTNIGVPKVSFYDGNTLLGVDSTFPYVYNWTNAPIGTHRLTAKVVDSEDTFALSAPVMMYVAGNTDVSPFGFTNAGQLTLRDSIQPILAFRNYGFQPLTEVMIHYQLDSQTIVNQLITGLNLNHNQTMTYNLPILRYGLGQHLLKAWTSAPNGTTDSNPMNDTLKYNFNYFDYNLCNNEFEPNNQIETARLVPTDLLIRSTFNVWGDPDAFMFTTTAERPYFSIFFPEIINYRHMVVYRYNPATQNYIWLGDSYSTMNIESSQIAGTYVVILSGAPQCYGFKITTAAVPPRIIWTSPASAQVFQQGVPVPLTVQLAGGTMPITRVLFYSDNLLIGIDSTAPYALNWQNAPIGTHPLKASVYSERSLIATDAAMTITIQGRLDANLLSINAPANLVTVDTSVFQVQLKNRGLDTLNSVTIQYRLNNGVMQSQNWTGRLATNAIEKIDLPVLRFVQAGTQVLKCWVSAPNGGVDNNQNNDTLSYSFGYSVCGDNYEPNNTPNRATPMQVNKPYYAKGEVFFDVDYYQFATTDARPHFKISAQMPWTHLNITLYEVNAVGDVTRLANGTRQTGNDLLVWNQNRRGGNYMVSVEDAWFSSSNCYELLVETSDTLLLRNEVVSANQLQFKLAPNPAHERVQILELGSELIDYQLFVTDVFGRNVWNQTAAGSDNQPIFIETKDWAKGIYFVTLRRAGQIRTEKLVID